jgi:uncharacterized protein YajQ (UPF0234 family)
MRKKANVVAEATMVIQDTTLRALVKKCIEEEMDKHFKEVITHLKAQMDKELKKHLVRVTARHFEEVSAEIMKSLY